VRARRFSTPVLHPNISASGEIDLDVLRYRPLGVVCDQLSLRLMVFSHPVARPQGYSPVLYAQLLLLSIVSFLTDPNPGCSDGRPGFEHALELSVLCQRDPSGYARAVEDHTRAHAIATPQRLEQELGRYSSVLAREVGVGTRLQEQATAGV
jgi:ubiquitin-protein ligase